LSEKYDKEKRNYDVLNHHNIKKCGGMVETILLQR